MSPYLFISMPINISNHWNLIMTWNVVVILFMWCKYFPYKKEYICFFNDNRGTSTETELFDNDSEPSNNTSAQMGNIKLSTTKSDSTLRVLFEKSTKLSDTEENTSLSENTKENEKLHADFSWIKYGFESSDWALLVDTSLCIEGSVNRKRLVIYTSQEYNLEKVSLPCVF